MNLMNIVILAIVQGLAELLPVSSSAHVVVAEKLLGLDPSAPPMTLLLVMLHTGTMFAVIVYFWRTWRSSYFRDAAALRSIAKAVIAATAVTGVIGFGIMKLVEKTAFANVPKPEIEDLFSHLEFIAPALATAGVLILIAGLLERRESSGRRTGGAHADPDPDLRQAGLIGAVQGLCLPFRGFSRSGATISAGMLLGLTKMSAETFSFALAVVLTPPVVAREVWRLVRAERLAGAASLGSTALMSVLGAAIAFGAGLVALKWLSGWLERGRWYLFGIYCLVAAAAVYALHAAGY
ncbi:MAG TPA: undecaprenyl-diphosphate phosphatase [Steroidobacteraceae bacterium]|nr:undecaprenyl-diphosphate phosphatase [Steroidobacteraceae bacterium]